VAGGAYFNEPELPYFLYLSSKGLLLDGIDIEGVGVEPDIEVTWPLKSDFKYDPQLEMAISVLSR
jgi:C-terminal processing protease CtpA/Prc